MIRTLTILLVALAASTLTFAQPENLIKNSDGDGDGKQWRAFGNAKIERCADGGYCFVLREGGYLTQDVDVPENSVGHYALLIGRAHRERSNAGAYLHGYMMNAGDPSGGRIYGYLSGQQMGLPDDAVGQWKHLWGVYRIAPGTKRIRLFLQHGQLKGVAKDDSRASFDDLGIYVFPTEQEALIHVAQRAPIQAASRKLLDPIPQCLYRRAAIPPVHGIQLGMSLEEIVALFPGSAEQPNVRRALELSKRHATGLTGVLIDNKTGSPDMSEIKQVFLRFRDRQLFSFSVHSSGPQWESVDKFIDERGDLLNLVGVNAWNSVEGNSRLKYLICDSVEIMFYASPVPTSNKNYISITDVAVETKAFQASKPTSPSNDRP